MDAPERDAEQTSPGIGAPRHRPGLGPREVPLAELLGWLTAEMQARDGCASVRVVGVERTPPGPDGCNWGYSLVLETAGVPWWVYVPPYLEAVRRGHALFNLE